MAIKDFWNRFFNKKNRNIATLEETDVSTIQEEDSSVPAPFDYGLDMLVFVLLRSENYGWSDPKPFKKVTLVNAKDCENKISLMGLVSAWSGTGHSEWEFLLAGLFLCAVLDALENESNEADISMLFDHDLLARDGRMFTQEQIYAHLIPWFEIIKDTDDALNLKLKIG
ncbi:MAG: hypothetical protein ACLTEH_03335 [Clostridia bacterium]